MHNVEPTRMTAWVGWIAFAGLALFTGRAWARAIGVVPALASAIVNIGFLAAYPIRSAMMMISFDVLVIWGLTVRGGELRQ
jgi:hypothetical protein